MNDNEIFQLLQRGASFKRKPNSTQTKKTSNDLIDTPTNSKPSNLDFFAKRPASALDLPEPKAKVPKSKQQSHPHDDEKPSNEAASGSESDSEDKEEIDEPVEVPAMTPKAMRKLKTKLKINADSGAGDLLIQFEQLKARYQVQNYLLKNIREHLGFTEPTPIQMQAIPALIEGNEVIACAPTGSGKTAAFSVPMLVRLKEPVKGKPRGLVLSPTRELAIQTYQQIQKLCIGPGFKACVLTKSTCPKESKTLQKYYDIIVTTPLRLVRLIQQKEIQLDGIEYLVLDEADQLFELGFLSQIDEIIAACSNPTILRSLFSATIPPGVEQMATSFLRDPIKVIVGTKNSAASTIKQRLIFCGQEDGKLLAMRQLIENGIKPPVIIFVQSKDRAVDLFKQLVYEHISVGVITSDRTKEQRDNTVKQFRLGNIWILIATDLMARGMDFRGVNLVINYDLPTTAIQYIHRIGRAGRAGREGEAITLYTEADIGMIRSIVSVMRASGMNVPDWMNSLPKIKKDKRKKPRLAPPARASISTGEAPKPNTRVPLAPPKSQAKPKKKQK